MAKHGSKANISRVLWLTSRGYFVKGIFLLLLSGIMNALVRPLVLMYAVRALDPTVASLDTAFGYAAMLGGVLWVENWSKWRGLMLCSYIGVLRSCQAGVHLVTLKAVRVHAGASNEGAEQTLIAEDLLGISEWAIYLPYVLIGITSLVCGVAMILITVGWVGLIGVGFMVLNLCGSVPLSVAAKKLQIKERDAAERIVGATKEVLDGVKVVKMMGWEDAYFGAVRERRVAQLKIIRKWKALINIVVQLGRSAPPLGTMFAVLGYSALVGELRADVIMPVISVFQTLRLPFIMLPLNVTLMTMISVSFRRLDNYMHLPEHQPTPTPPAGSRTVLHLRRATISWPKSLKETLMAAKEKEAKEAADAKVRVRAARRGGRLISLGSRAKREDTSSTHIAISAKVEGLNDAISAKVEGLNEDVVVVEEGAAQPPEHGTLAVGAVGAVVSVTAPAPAADADGDMELLPVLLNVDLELAPSSLVGVVGSVSSGKSSLLAVAWGEALVGGGELQVTDEVAMVPQKPFTIAGSLLDNILMGRPHDAARLQSVLEATALLPDMAQLPHAELTEVGERGVTLSGGQQQRIALARALYGEPRLLLLDDPLSAVDTRTAKILLQALIDYVHDEGTGRAALLAVNQSHHLHAFDRLLVLDGGQKAILYDGTVDELLAQGDKAISMFQGVAGGAVVDDLVLSAPETAPAPETATAPGMADMTKTAEALAPAAITDTAAAPEPESAGTVAALVEKEHKAEGTYGSALFFRYIEALGYPWVAAYLVMLTVTFMCYLFADLWLVAWIRFSSTTANQTAVAANASESGADDISGGDGLMLQLVGVPYHGYMLSYIGLVLLHTVSVMLTSLIFVFASAHASLTVYSDVMHRLIYAPISWYESTPSGRIISRLSSDMGIIDKKLSNDMDTLIQIVGMCTTFFVYIVASSWILLAVGLVVGVVFAALTWVADCSTREVRRIATNAVSPIMTTSSEAKSGAALIRCMGITPFFSRRQAGFAEAWAHVTFIMRCLMTWANIACTALVFAMSTITAFYIMATRTERTVEASSLTLTYAIMLPYFLAVASENFVTVRTNFAALERLSQYLTLPQEPKHVLPTDPPRGKWPIGGAIEFHDVSLRYRPGLPFALEAFNAHVAGGQKVGIVGRTGAGKSTLILAMFRLVEPTSGTVLIDGVDVLHMGLRALRRAITIIPQDPVLHSGTVSHNLDPFGSTDDSVLRDVLRRSQLPEEMLSHEVSKGGTNLSSGERQLLCFARSLLEESKILILDEATSNLDETSDAAIQALLRTEFSAHTVLTIAHRLLTVIDYDALIVMGGGRLLEHGAPQELLAREDGVLAAMARALGEAGEATLRERALLYNTKQVA